MIGEYEAREIAAKWAFPSDDSAMRALAERGEIRNEADLVGKGYWGGGETTLEAISECMGVALSEEGDSEADHEAYAELRALRVFVLVHGGQ